MLAVDLQHLRDGLLATRACGHPRDLHADHLGQLSAALDVASCEQRIGFECILPQRGLGGAEVLGLDADLSHHRILVMDQELPAYVGSDILDCRDGVLDRCGHDLVKDLDVPGHVGPFLGTGEIDIDVDVAVQSVVQGTVDTFPLNEDGLAHAFDTDTGQLVFGIALTILEIAFESHRVSITQLL